MLKKSLLAASLAWTGTVLAASSSLDDVTMNIVDDSTFREIINASPAEIEKILQSAAEGNATPRVVIKNVDGSFTTATPVAGQLTTVSRELNQGMVSFTLVCSEAQEACEKRALELNNGQGFMLNTGGHTTPAGTGMGDGAAQLPDAAPGSVQILEGKPLDGAVIPGVATGVGQ